MPEVSMSTISAPPPIIVQGAQVVLPSGELAMREVALAEGKITAIGTELEVTTNTQTIDGRGLTLLPGIVDSHVNFCAQGQAYQEAFLYTETLQIESCACARGGVTSFVEMPTEMAQALPAAEAQAVLRQRLAIASRHSAVNYGQFASAKVASELDLCALDKPIGGIQLSIGQAAHDFPSIEDAEIERLFAAGDCLIALQCSQHNSEATLKAIQAALLLSNKYKRRLHISNVSTGQAAALVREHKSSWVSANVTPQHLLLEGHLLDAEATGKAVANHGGASKTASKAAFKVTERQAGTRQTDLPQSEGDRKQLWQALLEGVIDTIATAHTPSELGIPGVETALPLMLTQAKENQCSIAKVAEWMSSGVARVCGIPKKGLIEPGYDADLVLVDLSTYRPVLRKELRSQSGWSPFENWTLTGWPVITIVGGHVVYERGHTDPSVRGQALQFDAN